jgi:hypothetical protein
MLARVMIETYITGMYCLYEPGAVAKLQSGQLKMLRPMLEFLREDRGILSGVPRDVLDECIRRLDAGTPADGPKVWVMAVVLFACSGITRLLQAQESVKMPAGCLAGLSAWPGFAWGRAMARSAYAHGGSLQERGPGGPADRTRKIIVAWTVLSADALAGRSWPFLTTRCCWPGRSMRPLPLRRFWEHAR